MLTPDERHLDRRIAQEAATLAGAGWSVDIHPAVDPGLSFEADLPAGVRLLANSTPPRRQSRLRRYLRPLKALAIAATPAAGRAIETVQYRTRSIAGEIADASLPRLLAGERYDVVFAHDVPVMPLALELKRRWRVPVISDLHEVFPEQDEFFTSAAAKVYWRRLEKDGIEGSDGIICVNDAIADYVADRYDRRERTAVILNAVPHVSREVLARGPTLRDLYPIAPDDRVLLFAGSLRAHKGLEELVDGFARARLDGVALALLGEGPLERELVSLARHPRLSGRLHVGKRADQRHLIATASSADVGLLPYAAFGFNHLIATPNKLFEYIQARIPIISSPLPMIERITAPLGNTVLLDFGDPFAIAAGLEAILSAPDRIPGDEVLEAAAGAVSWEAEEPRLLALVGAVVPGRRGDG